MKKTLMPNNLIVYTPGYSGMPPAKLNPLLRKFSNEGFDTLSINYKNFGRQDISDTARRTVKVLSPLRDSYNHITLLGHSMGGLVARKALSLSPRLADSLVTIGSPHKGSEAALRPFARLFGGRSVRQMTPDSKYLKYLGEPTVPTLTLTGEWDALVKDASLPCAKNITIPHGEHSAMLFSDRVFGEIYSWLQYEVISELPQHEEKGMEEEIEI